MSNNKKAILIVAGVGDGLCSPNSQKRIRNSDTFVEKVQNAINHLYGNNKVNGVVNFHYLTETFNDVNVFKDIKDTQLISMKIHNNLFLSKDNEMSILSHDGEELLFNGDEFSFIFRPEDYDVYICGIDLHGIFAKTIEDFLALDYNVSLFSDSLSALPATRKYVSSLKRNKNFSFCSYKSV